MTHCYGTKVNLKLFCVEGGYNEKTILLLAEDNNERLYQLKLTDSSTAVMEDLLEVSNFECNHKSQLR